MYAMNRQLKSLKLFIEIIEKGHSIEFEFNGNLYRFSHINDEYVLINYTTKNELHFKTIEEVMEAESNGLNFQKIWKKLKILSIR
ncbi:hypothetical protein ACWOA2_01230 [Granulicatella elegans]|jgi:hypothetical protein|uniref:hypothetical protein n=1 Tax=Granulicatella elegans TaxID=137732 RepID=UPI0001B908DD|nr:hypothetical protein [Granulicatella elegans]MBF0993529.1 hypothetical protein [Granulicatella sp.]